MLKIKAQTGMEGFRSPEEQQQHLIEQNQQAVIAMMDQITDLSNTLSTPGNDQNPNGRALQLASTIRQQLSDLYGILGQGPADPRSHEEDQAGMPPEEQWYPPKVNFPVQGVPGPTPGPQ